MKRLLLVIALCVVAQGQSVKQTMVNSPGGVQSAGSAATTPIPYDACPKGYRCQVIGWYECCASGGQLLPWKPIYYVHADGSKTVQYMIVGVETRLTRTRRSKRRAAHAQQPQKPVERQPVTLSAEGTASMLEFNRQIGELQTQIENLRLKQQLVMAREHVPEEYPAWRYDETTKRVIVFPPAAAKASPSPK